jgi:hypothetical protein
MRKRVTVSEHFIRAAILTILLVLSLALPRDAPNHGEYAVSSYANNRKLFAYNRF